MKKLVSIVLLLLFCSLLHEGISMNCSKNCDDTGKTIFIGPCSECTDGDWYIDCDGTKMYCPGHEPNQGLY